MKALNIDWSSLRAAAVAIGNVSAAARQAAAHLPPEEARRFVQAVSKRAVREHWLDKAAHAVQVASKEPKSMSGTMSAYVQNGHEVLDKLGPDTKLKLAIGVNKAVTHLSGLKPKQLAGESTALLQHAKIGSIVHSWQEQPANTAVMVNVNLLGVDLPASQVLDVEALPVSTSPIATEQQNRG